MTPTEFAQEVLRLTPEAQDEFFRSLRDVLPETEWMAAVAYVRLLDLFTDQQKYKSLRSALAVALFGVEIPASVKTMFDK